MTLQYANQAIASALAEKSGNKRRGKILNFSGILKGQVEAKWDSVEMLQR